MLIHFNNILATLYNSHQFKYVPLLSSISSSSEILRDYDDFSVFNKFEYLKIDPVILPSNYSAMHLNVLEMIKTIKLGPQYSRFHLKCNTEIDDFLNHKTKPDVFLNSFNSNEYLAIFENNIMDECTNLELETIQSKINKKLNNALNKYSNISENTKKLISCFLTDKRCMLKSLYYYLVYMNSHINLFLQNFNEKERMKYSELFDTLISSKKKDTNMLSYHCNELSSDIFMALVDFEYILRIDFNSLSTDISTLQGCAFL